MSTYYSHERTAVHERVETKLILNRRFEMDGEFSVCFGYFLQGHTWAKYPGIVKSAWRFNPRQKPIVSVTKIPSLV